MQSLKVANEYEYYAKSEVVIRQLLLRVNQKVYLRQFYPAFTALLHEHYAWGGSTTCYSRDAEKTGEHTLLGFDRHQSGRLLHKISTTLSTDDVKNWQSKIAPSLLTDMFLESIFASRRGAVYESPIEHFVVKISVFDRESNELLVAKDVNLFPEKKQRFHLVEQNGRFQEVSGSIMASLDHDLWMIDLDIDIEFKPHGAIFNCLIPLAGRGKIYMRHDKQTTWVFEHVYSPSSRSSGLKKFND